MKRSLYSVYNTLQMMANSLAGGTTYKCCSGRTPSHAALKGLKQLCACILCTYAYVVCVREHAHAGTQVLHINEVAFTELIKQLLDFHDMLKVYHSKLLNAIITTLSPY
jgi:hypothetical protein